MRRIETEQERENRQKRNKWILGIILIIIMLGSTAGYAFSLISGSSSGAQGSQELPNGEPYFDGRSWIVQKEGKLFALSSSLEDTQNISVSISAKTSDYIGIPVYIASSNLVVEQEIAGFMQNYASRVQRACYGVCEEELPEKDCTSNLVVWVESNESRVRQEDKCIFIEGDVRAADAFIYNILGIK